MKPSFSLKWLFFGVAVAGLAMACLLNATATLGCFLRSLYGSLLILSAILAIWRSNAFCGGVAVAGALQTILFFEHVGGKQVFSDVIIYEMLMPLLHSGNAASVKWAAMLNVMQVCRDTIVAVSWGVVAHVLAKKAKGLGDS